MENIILISEQADETIDDEHGRKLDLWCRGRNVYVWIKFWLNYLECNIFDSCMVGFFDNFSVICMWF